MGGEARDWDKVAEWEARLARGESLDLDPESLGLLTHVALDVAIAEVEVQAALRTPTETATLVREVRRRIREGSRRLMRAISEANRRKEDGDVAGARKVFEDVLFVEVVPHYRRHVEAELSYLDDE